MIGCVAVSDWFPDRRQLCHPTSAAVYHLVTEIRSMAPQKLHRGTPKSTTFTWLWKTQCILPASAVNFQLNTLNSKDFRAYGLLNLYVRWYFQAMVCIIFCVMLLRYTSEAFVILRKALVGHCLNEHLIACQDIDRSVCQITFKTPENGKHLLNYRQINHQTFDIKWIS